MKCFNVIAALLSAVVVCISGIALAQSKFQSMSSLGALEYTSNCAVCHGPNGKGNGPYSNFDSPRPADLTALAKNNGGVLPVHRIYEMIDGRRSAPELRTLHMPIWGAQYLEYAVTHSFEFDMRADGETVISSRILSLIEHIGRLQVLS